MEYGRDINVFCDGEEIDSNGNIFLHSGNIKAFKQGNRDNEPISHDGNFTLFNSEVLGVGSQWVKYAHEGIKKGNEIYTYYKGSIPKGKTIKIKDVSNGIIKEEQH